MKNLKNVVLVLGLVIFGSVTQGALALDNVSESEVRAKLCSAQQWDERHETILNACWTSVGHSQPGPGEVTVFGFLMNGSDICYLPCDYAFFYLNSGN
jgi:hypothetical protein